MPELTNNTRQRYESVTNRKRQFQETLNESAKRELRWQKEMAEEGVDYQPSIGALIAPSWAGVSDMVPDPPILLETALWLSGRIMEDRRRFVPPWNDYKFTVRRGFGVEPGLYEGMDELVARLFVGNPEDREDLWKQFTKSEEEEGYFAVAQCVSIERARTICSVAPSDMLFVMIRGVRWKEHYAELEESK